MQKIGLGGSCHWCTEGIFRSVIGVKNVRQGWISANAPNGSYSEAIVFDYDTQQVSLHDLIALHLHSHSCTKSHSLRQKYRSGIYVFDKKQETQSKRVINLLQQEFKAEIITEVLYFNAFKLNIDEHLDYYHKDPQKPFCTRYITPKLRSLMKRYSNAFDPEMTIHLGK